MYIGRLPTFLFKYQNPNLQDKIGKTIRFSVGKTFNDIYDGQIYPNSSGVKEIETLKKQFIFCASKNSTNNVMWGNYADDHKGFCIAYNPLQLIDQTNAAWSDSIHYSQLSLLDDDDSMEDGGIVDCQHGIDINKPPSNMPNIVRFQFRKETSWSYEDEFRLILADTNDDYQLNSDIQVNHDVIEKIVFGFRADYEMILNVMNEFKDTNILFFKANPSLSEYKIRHDVFLYIEGGVVKLLEEKDLSRLINRTIISARNSGLAGEISRSHLSSLKAGDFKHFKTPRFKNVF